MNLHERERAKVEAQVKHLFGRVEHVLTDPDPQTEQMTQAALLLLAKTILVAGK